MDSIFTYGAFDANAYRHGYLIVREVYETGSNCVSLCLRELLITNYVARMLCGRFRTSKSSKLSFRLSTWISAHRVIIRCRPRLISRLNSKTCN